MGHEPVASAGRTTSTTSSSLPTSTIASSSTLPRRAWSPPPCLRLLPPPVLLTFENGGIESETDIAMMFVSKHEVDDYVTEHGWDDGTRQAVHAAWAEARHRTQRSMAAVKVSFTPQQPSPPMIQASATSGTSSTVAPAVVTASTPSSSPTVIEMQEVDSQPVNTVRQQDHVRQTGGIEVLKHLFFDMGARGLHWQRGMPHVQELRWTYLMRAGLRITGTSVQKHVKAWTTWKHWITEVIGVKDVNLIYQPDAILLAQFLDMETARGPTLGRSRSQSFRWLKEKIGLPFPVNDVLVTDFRHFPLQHISKSATTFAPAFFLNMLANVHRHTPVKSQETQLVMLMAVACLRHKHMAISRLTGNTDDFLLGLCPEGKSRKRGTRPPFHWAIPRLPCIPNTFSFLISVAEKLHSPDFLIPARAKTRMLPARRWLARPMGHMMAMRMIRQMLLEAGMGQQ